MRPHIVAEIPLRSAQLLRTAQPTLLLCWRARYSSRCTPSRCRQRRSPFRCSVPAPHPAACPPTRPPARRVGRRPNLSPSVGVFPCPFARFPPGSARHLPVCPRAHAAAAAHVQRRFSPTGTVYLHTHSPGLVILSGQYSRPGSPAGRALRGKENLQRSNKGAAFCVRHSDTSSCGRTGMKQASSLALVACRIERVQRHAPAYHLVCTNWIYFNYRRPKSCGLKKYCQLLQ